MLDSILYFATPVFPHPATVLKNCNVPPDIASCIMRLAKSWLLFNNTERGSWNSIQHVPLKVKLLFCLLHGTSKYHNVSRKSIISPVAILLH